MPTVTVPIGAPRADSRRTIEVSMLDAYGSGSVGRSHRSGKRSPSAQSRNRSPAIRPTACSVVGDCTPSSAFSSASESVGRPWFDCVPNTIASVPDCSWMSITNPVDANGTRKPDVSSGRSRCAVTPPVAISSSSDADAKLTNTDVAVVPKTIVAGWSDGAASGHRDSVVELCAPALAAAMNSAPWPIWTIQLLIAVCSASSSVVSSAPTPRLSSAAPGPAASGRRRDRGRGQRQRPRGGLDRRRSRRGEHVRAGVREVEGRGRGGAGDQHLGQLGALRR
jgi:hypothetical protein